MNEAEAAILQTLVNAYGAQEARHIFGAYRLAETVVVLDQERKAAQTATPPARRPRKSGPTPLRGAESDTA